MVLQSEGPPCEGGWRGVSLVGRVFRRLLLSACGGVLNPSVCCADSSPRRGAKLPATSPYRIHDRAEKIESSDTAPIRAAPACLQKSLFRQAELYPIADTALFLSPHGFLWDEKFRSSLWEGLRIPKAAPLVADRSRRNPNNTKSAGGEPKQSGGLFWRGEPSPGVPLCEAKIPQFSVKSVFSCKAHF